MLRESSGRPRPHGHWNIFSGPRRRHWGARSRLSSWPKASMCRKQQPRSYQSSFDAVRTNTCDFLWCVDSFTSGELPERLSDLINAQARDFNSVHPGTSSWDYPGVSRHIPEKSLCWQLSLVLQGVFNVHGHVPGVPATALTTRLGGPLVTQASRRSNDIWAQQYYHPHSAEQLSCCCTISAVAVR